MIKILTTFGVAVSCSDNKISQLMFFCAPIGSRSSAFVSWRSTAFIYVVTSGARSKITTLVFCCSCFFWGGGGVEIVILLLSRKFCQLSLGLLCFRVREPIWPLTCLCSLARPLEPLFFYCSTFFSLSLSFFRPFFVLLCFPFLPIFAL